LAYTSNILLTRKLCKRGDIVPVVLLRYVLGDNCILIAGCRPAQAFVTERSLCAHRFGNSN